MVNTFTYTLGFVILNKNKKKNYNKVRGAKNEVSEKNHIQANKPTNEAINKTYSKNKNGIIIK